MRNFSTDLAVLPFLVHLFSLLVRRRLPRAPTGGRARRDLEVIPSLRGALRAFSRQVRYFGAMLDILKTGTADEIIDALKSTVALTDPEVIELCAVWKTHQAAGVKKEAKKALEKLAPGPYDALKTEIKASLGNDDRKITKKLAALEAGGGFTDVAALAEAFSRRTEEHLGLNYLCQVGGPLARTALETAVSDEGYLDLTRVEGFPDELTQLKGVRSLGLRGCGLKALPPAVLSMKDLTTLDLSHNRFNVLPDDIRELPRLQKLVFHDVPLNKGLGEGIYDLADLRELWIIRAKMKTIPDDIGRMKSLEHLRYVQCDKVEAIPDGVADLPNLRSLVVDWCNLKAVNPVVWTLTGLEHLDLSQSPLDQVPPEIGRMKKLKKLRLLCKGLGELPDEICECTELEDFDIRGQMTRLPDAIGNWKKLKKFSVSFCPFLESIPESFWSIPGLETIDLSYTRLPEAAAKRARKTWPNAYVTSK